jgi:hypothetical protein
MFLDLATLFELLSQQFAREGSSTDDSAPAVGQSGVSQGAAQPAVMAIRLDLRAIDAGIPKSSNWARQDFGGVHGAASTRP